MNVPMGFSCCQSSKTMLHMFLLCMHASILKYHDENLYVCACMLSCSKQNIIINIHIGKGVVCTIPRQKVYFLLAYSGHFFLFKMRARKERENNHQDTNNFTEIYSIMCQVLYFLKSLSPSVVLSIKTFLMKYLMLILLVLPYIWALFIKQMAV